MRSLWEILVPKSSNEGIEFTREFHNQWDEKVRNISGGLTILKTAIGQWVSPDEKTFVERMIPVRIYCTEEQIDNIVNITLEHYGQRAVLAYEISKKVKLKYRK